ncbi:hypothetical protein [Flavobacterium branchiophilum]|uniref:hypothetical protein n=1 Tax=Flavobacterium branchiophilum TaxID=55197 RepID=UPI001681B3B7|nr:hypothetical protein [Flavobacterium branchiophilum]
MTLIENSSGEAPINLVSTSHDQLTVAETGVNHLYTQFNMPTQTFNSNTSFVPIAVFTPPSGAGGLWKFQLYY